MHRWTFSIFALGTAALLAGCAATPAAAPAPLSPPAPQRDHVDADDIIRSTARPATRPVIVRAPTTRPAPKVVAKAPPPAPKPNPETWTGHGKCEGIASFYAGKFIGRRTANGERYTGKQLTAAHRVLPFGTMVRVLNLKNGLDVTVRINDRGPFIAGRIIDLSPAAAKKLHMTQDGIVQVRLEVVNEQW
jgi:rare lipoprotein A